MCIIVVKNKGIKMPNKEILRNCFENNDDGGGFMYAHNNNVYIKKGFMTFESFYKSLKDTIKIIGDDAPMVLHFRISTQGGINKECCHPFALSNNMDELRKLNNTCRIGIAHNGIISLTTTYEKNINYNDTMAFIVDYLSLIINNKDDLFIDKNVKLINKLANSKLAFLCADGDIKLIGDGWILKDGIYYSNSSYEKRTYTLSYTNYLDDYKNINNEYLFNEYECPYFESGDIDYCAKCVNRNYCWDWCEYVEN